MTSTLFFERCSQLAAALPSYPPCIRLARASLLCKALIRWRVTGLGLAPTPLSRPVQLHALLQARTPAAEPAIKSSFVIYRETNDIDTTSILERISRRPGAAPHARRRYPTSILLGYNIKHSSHGARFSCLLSAQEHSESVPVFRKRLIASTATSSELRSLCTRFATAFAADCILSLRAARQAASHIAADGL